MIHTLFRVTLWNFCWNLLYSWMEASHLSPRLLTSSLSLLSSHSPCLIRSVISPHSGWCLLIWQHYCLPVGCCCRYCLLSHLTNSTKAKEKGNGEKIAANHAVSHNWLCKSAWESLCLPMVHEMCACFCNFAHISFLPPLSTWDGQLSLWLLRVFRHNVLHGCVLRLYVRYVHVWVYLCPFKSFPEVSRNNRVKKRKERKKERRNKRVK